MPPFRGTYKSLVPFLAENRGFKQSYSVLTEVEYFNQLDVMTRSRTCEPTLCFSLSCHRCWATALCPVFLLVISTELMSNVGLTVMPGDRVGLVGQNGAGKSTLLQCIAGYRTMDDGKCIVKTGARMGERMPTHGTGRGGGGGACSFWCYPICATSVTLSFKGSAHNFVRLFSSLHISRLPPMFEWCSLYWSYGY